MCDVNADRSDSSLVGVRDQPWERLGSWPLRALDQSRDGTGRPLHATKRLWLLALTPVGMIIVGIFDLSKMMPHMVGFLFVTVAPIATFPMTGRVLRRTSCWRSLGTGLLIASPITLTLTIAVLPALIPTPPATTKVLLG